MLHLILGEVGSGKSSTLDRRIKETVSAGRRSFLIVPEDDKYVLVILSEAKNLYKQHIYETHTFTIYRPYCCNFLQHPRSPRPY